MKQCPRCAAMMVSCWPLRFYASTDMSEQTFGYACRCPSCGHYEDNRINMNRNAMKLAGVR